VTPRLTIRYGAWSKDKQGWFSVSGRVLITILLGGVPC
jgi:hypothetical protein